MGDGAWPQLSAVTGLRWGFLFRFALLIQLEQPGQDLGIVRLILPAVGCQHGGVEGGVGIRQPGRPLVVEIGERTLLEILFRYWQATDGGRVEPSYSAIVEDPGGFGYGFSIFGSGRREGESIKRARGRVARPALKLCPLSVPEPTLDERGSGARRRSSRHPDRRRLTRGRVVRSLAAKRRIGTSLGWA